MLHSKLHYSFEQTVKCCNHISAKKKEYTRQISTGSMLKYKKNNFIQKMFHLKLNILFEQTIKRCMLFFQVPQLDEAFASFYEEKSQHELSMQKINVTLDDFDHVFMESSSM